MGSSSEQISDLRPFDSALPLGGSIHPYFELISEAVILNVHVY